MNLEDHVLVTPSQSVSSSFMASNLNSLGETGSTSPQVRTFNGVFLE
jgi:hypothetical protein